MRFVIRFLVGFVVVLALVWAGLWWYAEGRMEAAIAGWADGVAAKGGQVSYDSLKRGTSPFAATVSLANLNVALPPTPRGSAVVTLPSFALRIGLANPLLMHVVLPNRITIGFNGVSSVLAFQTIAATEQLDPRALTARKSGPFRGGVVDAGGIDLLASSGSLLVLHVDRLHSDYRYDPGAGAGAAALASNVEFDGMALSPLLTHLLSLPFDGKITRLADTLRLSGPVPAALPGMVRQMNKLPADDFADRQKLAAPVLRSWAAAGGNGALRLDLSVGPTVASAAGTIKFDANVQPAGTATLNADHLDAFTAALLNAYPQAQGYVAQAEARLSPYLSGTSAGGQVLAVQAVYGAGTVTVNGKPAGKLPPIDWDALQNPPPAAVPGQ